MKSKPNTRKVMTRARNWEIYSSRNKEHAKAREGKRAGYGPRPSRYKIQFPFQHRRAETSLFSPKPASKSTSSLVSKPEKPA
jgi:hypothetical protein